MRVILTKFTINNIYTTVEEDNLKSCSTIDEVCTFTHTYFINKWVCLECNKVTSWRARKPFCDRCNLPKTFKQVRKKPRPEFATLKYYRNNRFPTGLLRRIMKELKNGNLPFRWTDNREVLTHSYTENTLQELRYYQKNAVQVILEKARGIIKVPTRGGKTHIAADLIFKIGQQALIIVADLHLLNQTHKFLEENTDPTLIGFIGDSVYAPALFNVATIQTLWSRFNNPEVQKLLKETEVLIIDEAHHVNLEVKKNEVSESNSWMQIVLFIPAYYRIGLTATPGNDNEINRCLLEATTGSIIYEIPLNELQEKGYVSEAVVEIYNYTHNEVTWKDWRDAENKGIITNEKRNLFICKIAEKYDKQIETVLVTVNKVKHAKALLKVMPGALYLVGVTKTPKRQRIIKVFESGESRVLITTLFKEGADLQFDNILMAGVYKNEKDVIQRSARVLTAVKDKKFGRIIDIYDKDDNILEKHSKERIRIYKKQEYKISYKEES